MSHGFSPVTIKDVPAIVEAAPLSISKFAKVILWALILNGLVAFWLGVSGGEPKHAWTSFHVNFTYWFILAAASSSFAAVLQICNAKWSRPIGRVFQAASPFFLYSVVPLIILFFGHEHLFEWANEPIPGKALWLSSNFVFARDLLGILILATLARKVIFYSLRRDLGAIRSGLTGVKGEKLERWSDKYYDKYVAGWGSDAKAELRDATDRMGRLSPVVVIVYAIVVTLIAFDQIMSVDAEWYSTLFGAFVFMSGVYLAMAWTSIGVGFSRLLHPLFFAKIERRTLHDLGKLLFGFGIFWAYLFWSHYLTIWYGNMPEETEWVITRMREQPWHHFAWVILGTCFIIPFILGLSRDVKQVPILLFATGVIVAVGIWLQQYLLFAPTLYPHVIPLALSDASISLGFLGAYLLSAVHFLEKMPLMPFGDLYIES